MPDTLKPDPLGFVQDQTERDYLRHFMVGVRADGTPVMRWDADRWRFGWLFDRFLKGR